MSDLGKIRAGSQRVYRDKVFGRKGEIVVLNPDHSVDGEVRYVFHPDDITEGQEARLEEYLLVRDVANGLVSEVWRKFMEKEN